MDTSSFLTHIKTKYFSEHIPKDVKEVFDTSKYKVEKSSPIGKNNKVLA